jgi:hypothetical protein
MTLSVLPGSIRHSSVYNLLPPFEVVSIALKGYSDGSGAPEKRYLTLGGMSGTFEAWSDFERRWEQAVSPWQAPSSGPTFSVWHSKHAFHLNGEFSHERGWTHKEVSKVFQSIFNQCLSPICYHRRSDFCASTAIIDMDDYRRACLEFPTLEKTKPAHALLVDFVVSQGLSLLPYSKRLAAPPLTARRIRSSMAIEPVASGAAASRRSGWPAASAGVRERRAGTRAGRVR